jgi:hypothetical protein
MTITLFATAGQRFGPGMQVIAETDVPSTHAGPFMEVSLEDPLLSETIADGIATWSGAANVPAIAILGLTITGGIQAPRPQFGIADGGSVTLTVTFGDSTGTLDTQDFTGFLWDPTTGLPVIVQAIAVTGGGLTPPQQAELDSIRDAVIQNFTNIP